MSTSLLPAAPRAAGDPTLPTVCRVTRVARETRDCWTLSLAPEDGRDCPPYAPGQFNMLYLVGVGEVPISMSGDVAERGAWVHTIRAVGAVTSALCALKRGARVGVRGPFGTPWPMPAAEGRDVVLVAGGIGLAPLRPALYALLAQRDQFGKVVLLYGARTPEDLLFRRQLSTWRGRFDLNVSVTVDRAQGDWPGHVGVVTHLVRQARFSPSDALAMICGPEVMMRFSATELLQRGVPAAQVYVSMERNMKCAMGLCGHCQFGADFVCLDGPVFPYERVHRLLHVREL